MTMTMEQIVRDAQEAFWKVVVQHFPEAISGDFGPEETIRFDAACRDAIKTYMRWNVPGNQDSRDQNVFQDDDD